MYIQHFIVYLSFNLLDFYSGGDDIIGIHRSSTMTHYGMWITLHHVDQYGDVLHCNVYIGNSGADTEIFLEKWVY